MRILKILLISTALAAFGAGSALATTAPLATTGQPTAKKSTKVVKKKATVKKVVKAKKKKKITLAKATKPKTKPAPSTETETAPGNPPN
jgi:hypothetical protein